MNLVVFDVDGTLTQTNQVDDECLVQAFLEEFSLFLAQADWSQNSHMTDSCIFRETFLYSFGRPPTLQETQRFQARFLSLLQVSHQRNPHRFLEMPGASTLLFYLRGLDNWKVAIATGGWKASASYKLACIGADASAFPMGSADDGISREEIVLKAIQRAQAGFRVTQFESVVYVGDGVWDARTCKNLGIPFVGITGRMNSDQLVAEGAIQVFSDYISIENFVSFLDNVPVSTGLKVQNELLSKKGLPISGKLDRVIRS